MDVERKQSWLASKSLTTWNGKGGLMRLKAEEGESVMVVAVAASSDAAAEVFARVSSCFAAASSALTCSSSSVLLEMVVDALVVENM